MQTGLARTLGYAEARHASRGHQLNQARPTLPLDRDRGNLSIWFHSRSLSVHAAAPVSRRVHAPKQEEVRPWCSCGVRTVLPDNARIAAPSLTPLFAFLRVYPLKHVCVEAYEQWPICRQPCARHLAILREINAVVPFQGEVGGPENRCLVSLPPTFAAGPG